MSGNISKEKSSNSINQDHATGQGITPTHKEIVQRAMYYISENISQLEQATRYLVNEGVLSFEEREQILTKGTGAEKCRCLLEMFCRKDANAFEKLKTALTLELSNIHVLDHVKDHKEILCKAGYYISENISEFEKITRYLVSERVLSLEEREQIFAKETKAERCQRLLEMFCRKDAKAYEKFKTALKLEPSNKHVLEHLEAHERRMEEQ